VVMPNVERLVELAAIFGCEPADLLTAGSSRPEDQARRLQSLLSTLKAADRALVLEAVERLVAPLTRGEGTADILPWNRTRRRSAGTSNRSRRSETARHPLPPSGPLGTRVRPLPGR